MIVAGFLESTDRSQSLPGEAVVFAECFGNECQRQSPCVQRKDSFVGDRSFSGFAQGPTCIQVLPSTRSTSANFGPSFRGAGCFDHLQTMCSTFIRLTPSDGTFAYYESCEIAAHKFSLQHKSTWSPRNSTCFSQSLATGFGGGATRSASTTATFCDGVLPRYSSSYPHPFSSIFSNDPAQTTLATTSQIHKRPAEGSTQSNPPSLCLVQGGRITRGIHPVGVSSPSARIFDDLKDRDLVIQIGTRQISQPCILRGTTTLRESPVLFRALQTGRGFADVVDKLIARIDQAVNQKHRYQGNADIAPVVPSYDC